MLGDLLTSSASGRSWVSSSYPHYVAFFWVTALAAAHLQLQIQAACESMNSLREDAKHRQDIKGHTFKAQSLTRESGLPLEAQ